MSRELVFEIYRDKKFEWHWVLRGGNGRVMAESVRMKSRLAIDRQIAVIQATAHMAKVVDTTELDGRPLRAGIRPPRRASPPHATFRTRANSTDASTEGTE